MSWSMRGEAQWSSRSSGGARRPERRRVAKLLEAAAVCPGALQRAAGGVLPVQNARLEAERRTSRAVGWRSGRGGDGCLPRSSTRLGSSASTRCTRTEHLGAHASQPRPTARLSHLSISLDMAPSAPGADERSPLLQPHAAVDDLEDPTKLPKGKRNAILCAVWLGVFVRPPLLLLSTVGKRLLTQLSLSAARRTRRHHRTHHISSPGV